MVKYSWENRFEKIIKSSVESFYESLSYKEQFVYKMEFNFKSRDK